MKSIFLIFALAACDSRDVKAPQRLGGEIVSAGTLNVGHDTYLQFCMQCHGVNGDGLGPAAAGMNPPPRDFRAGLFKFASVTSGQLPTDDDLKRTVREGLRGTQMLAWDLSPERLDAVVQYIKTFSPLWTTDVPGPPQATSPDPFGPAQASAAAALGKKIYHGFSQCYTCHPAYASPAFIAAASREFTGLPILQMRDHLELSVLQESAYAHKFMPPDFTKSPIKSGGDVASIYRTLGAGIGGTTMPPWKGALSATGDFRESERRLWALAYYVHELHLLKDDPIARKTFFQDLKH